ncbi:alpha-glucosidase domain-containing protein [uncultured Paraglaciecola sp.]|uniref:alpha-glucosidase domain-containing protein n=1 Tax=uncultured Paraglaciecola sp. TaxID=1765024 RepID=UPI0025D78606|nr:alpha-glucosidase domain-containing protein [uncultured Paraglaciecola sp.]
MYFSKQAIFSTRALKTVSLFVFVVFSYLTQAAEYQSNRLEGNGLVVLTDQGKVTLTAYSAQAFEVFYQPTNTKQLPSFALVESQHSVDLDLKNTLNTLELSTGELKAVIDKSPLKMAMFL